MTTTSNPPCDIDSTEPEDLQDIDGHLRGGIPEREILDDLARYWQVIPRRCRLVQRCRPPRLLPVAASHRRGEARHLRPRRVHCVQRVRDHAVRPVEQAHTPRLQGFAQDGHRSPSIQTLSEEFCLATLRPAPLLDAYDVYQHLMDDRAETMQDDCYLVAADGWKTGAQPREIRQVKNKDGKLVWPEAHDYKKGKHRFKSDLDSGGSSHCPLFHCRTGCHRSHRRRACRDRAAA